MTVTEVLKASGPAAPIFLIAVCILIQARRRWKGRFQRGNGRPAVPCAVCGHRYQRGLPLQWHMDSCHAKKGKNQ